MSGAFRLREGVGWADFVDSFAIVADRTLVRFDRDPDAARSLFRALTARGEVATGELEQLLPEIDTVDLTARLIAAGVLTEVDARPDDLDGMARTLELRVPSERDVLVGLDTDIPWARSVVADAIGAVEGVGLTDADPDVHLVLGSTPAELARRSADRWSTGRPHLPLSAYDGRHLMVGPLAIPSPTACFDCLRLRRGAATTWPDAHWDLGHAPEFRQGWKVADLELAVRLALRVVTAAFIEGEQTAAGHVTALDPTRLTMYTSRLWKVPRCPTCSAIETFSTNYPWSAGADSAPA